MYDSKCLRNGRIKNYNVQLKFLFTTGKNIYKLAHGPEDR